MQAKAQGSSKAFDLQALRPNTAEEYGAHHLAAPMRWSTSATSSLISYVASSLNRLKLRSR